MREVEDWIWLVVTVGNVALNLMRVLRPKMWRWAQ